MGLPQRAATQSRYTYADYCTWNDDERYELIDGQAYAMGPSPLRQHQKLLGNLYRQVADSLEGKPCEVYFAPFDVRLPRGDEADAEIDTVVQPDLVVVCDSAKLDERGCRGAPDWVVEVLSPSTAGHDHVRKLALYQRAGVGEYWLVHPTDHIVTVYRRQGAVFGPAEVSELVGELAVAILPGLRIDWARVVAEPPPVP